MLKPWLPALLFALLATAPALADTIGFKELTLPAAASGRALHLALWYPAKEGGEAFSAGENAAFFGLPVAKGAEPGEGLHPLVVMSHGYGGNWRNQGWLAGELVRHGYVVAAPDHPGTTSFDRDPAAAARLWERPRDLGRVIDALLVDPRLAGPIDPKRIAAIGHSLGGWTVAELAGARFDADRFDADCRTASSLRACTVYADLGLARNAEARAALGGDLRDARIGAVVSLDLGLARGFTPESLAAVAVPVLIIAAGRDIGGMPASLESGYLAKALPPSRSHFVEIADAAHFSFLPLCKPGAAARIEAETPGEGIVCEDGGGRERSAIHAEVVDRVIAFLALALPAPPAQGTIAP